jgi:23S rRNA pseudouridine1911/1915/1917 synthase
MYNIKLIVPTARKGIRLDKFITDEIVKSIPEITRSRVKKIVTDGCVQHNGEVIADPSIKVKGEQIYYVEIKAPIKSEITATEIPLDIVYEDDDMLVINKQAGLTVHPGAGNHNQTLVNALLAYCPDSLSGINGVERPGIVHRLDKNTSGLMVVAKNDKAHVSLATQLQERTLKRVYVAVIWGVIKPFEGMIEGNITRSSSNRKIMTVSEVKGREAITEYKVEKIFGKMFASLVECRLQTGRTHQIRVHFAHKKHPLIGDPEYGNNHRTIMHTVKGESQNELLKFKRQALHSKAISFIHPTSGEEMSFTAEMPEDMQKLVGFLSSM